jgi:thiosulfate dehydrogenase
MTRLKPILPQSSGRLRTLLLTGLVLLAALAGVGAGYLAWGRPHDWYAVPDVAKLPNAPENELIRYGQQLILNTPRFIGQSAADPAMRFAGNDLACTQCHQNGGLKRFAAPFISTYATFPMMSDDHVLTLEDRINGCMMRSMNGKQLPENGREMQAMVAYLRYVSTGTPEDVRVAGMGLKSLHPAAQTPDQGRGKLVYDQMCARCHGANGQGVRKEPPGVGFGIPPLWGPGSFNAAAGMANITTAAAFIRANMPYLTDYTQPMLTEQQAWDVAAFVTAQPRPPVPPASSQ